MNKLNKTYANILIILGILKITTLIIFGIAQINSISPIILNTIKLIISIIEPSVLFLNIIMIILNINTKSKAVSGYLLSYIAPILEYFIPQTTLVLIAKIILPSYIYITAGKIIKKKTNQSTPQPVSKKCKILTIIYIFIISLLTIIKVSISTIEYFKRAIKEVDTLNDISEPIQINYEEDEIKPKTIKNISINPVASYIISGRVTNAHKYNGYDNFNKISPIDISISWGKTANEEVNKEVKYYSIGDRKVYTRYPYDTDYNNAEISNNHLVPATNKIKKQLELISIGDYIKIEGELINANTKNWFVSTSTNRNDSGDGACEIIYVTKVTWLKEK